MMGGFMGGNSSNGMELNISGGTIYVDAGGDGFDSNGSMTISGGTVIVNGPTDNSNAALDSETGILLNGGLVIAAGSSGMVENPEDDSEQYSVSATFTQSLDAETLVTLCDSTGAEIISFAPAKKFANVIISSPEISSGETYTIYTGGSTSSDEKYGLYTTGGYNNDGEEAGSFTADDMVSYVGSQSGMMGGGGFGGGKGGGFSKDDIQITTDENGEIELPDGFELPDGIEITTNENGEIEMPDDFEMPTNENGENEMPGQPDGGFGGGDMGRGFGGGDKPDGDNQSKDN
jgi:hypothetical protein